MKQLIALACAALASLILPLQAAKAENVLAFGDSITQGGIDPAGSDYGGYPLVLQQMYENAGLGVYVYNFGRSGEKTGEGVNRIGGVVGRGGEFILIQEGNNDVILGYSPQTIRRNLGIMIDKSRAAGVEPLLSTLTPDAKHGLTDYIQATVNPEIVALAAEKGVTLVDNFGAVAESWVAWSFDGLHPNYDGMYALASNWYGYVPIAGAGGGGGSAKSSGGDDGGGGGCFIATAAYGSLIEPQVTLLRRFRDTVLQQSAPGRSFIRGYYRFSPEFASFINAHPQLKGPVRVALYPLVGLSYLLTNGMGSLLAALVLAALGGGIVAGARRSEG